MAKGINALGRFAPSALPHQNWLRGTCAIKERHSELLNYRIIILFLPWDLAHGQDVSYHTYSQLICIDDNTNNYYYGLVA